MRNNFISTLLDEAQSNPDLILITGDLGFGVLEEFENRLPNQFINAGVAEQTMMSMAAGIASTNKRVFVYSIGNFPSLRCLEQIRNDVCLMENPVVIVSVGAGYAYGSQGYTHHAIEDVSCLRSMPNLEVYTPADSGETKQITKFLAKSSKPAYLRLGKSSEETIHDKQLNFSNFDFVEIFNGSDGSILFNGTIGTLAIEARNDLKKLGIDIGVYSVPFVSRINLKTLTYLSERGPILTLEEHTVSGGFGSAVLEQLSYLNISTKVKILGSTRSNLSAVGNQAYLREINGLKKELIVQYFLELD